MATQTTQPDSDLLFQLKQYFYNTGGYAKADKDRYAFYRWLGFNIPPHTKTSYTGAEVAAATAAQKQLKTDPAAIQTVLQKFNLTTPEGIQAFQSKLANTTPYVMPDSSPNSTNTSTPSQTSTNNTNSQYYISPLTGTKYVGGNGLTAQQVALQNEPKLSSQIGSQTSNLSNSGGSNANTLPDGTPIPKTGDPATDALLTQINGYLTKLSANGQVINPNVQITPDQLAVFAKQASSEIHPYFATQLQTVTDQYLSNLGYNIDQLNNQVDQTQSQYSRSLDTLASNAADQGFAQSGIRAKQENQLAQDTQNSISNTFNSARNSATNAAYDYAKTYGGQAALTLGNPTINQPRVLPGQSKFDQGTSVGLYQLSPNLYNNLIGSEQNTEKSATDTLASQLASNSQTQQANNTSRQLNLT